MILFVSLNIMICIGVTFTTYVIWRRVFLQLSPMKLISYARVFYMPYIKKVEHHNFQHPILTINNGILYHKGKSFLNKISSLKISFLHEYPETPTGGHAGIFKTSKQLNQNIFGKACDKM